MSLQLIDRFHIQRRRELQSALDAGRMRKRDELTLLDPEQIRPLAIYGLLLLLVGGVFFAVLDLVVAILSLHTWWPTGLSWWSLLVWLVLNVAGYVLILPIHEAIHALAFLFWGGRPHFGARLPLVLYCGAREQLFRRTPYLTIGLAPLVVISLVGIILPFLSPPLAFYAFFALVGNLSGAVGDIWVVRRLLQLPAHVWVEDTETGYRAWEIA